MVYKDVYGFAGDSLIEMIAVFLCHYFGIFCESQIINVSVAQEPVHIEPRTLGFPSGNISQVPELVPSLTYSGDIRLEGWFFSFRGSCLGSVHKDFIGDKDCAGWTYKNNRYEIFIVSNQSWSDMVAVCEHEMYHKLSNSSFEMDHLFMTLNGIPDYQICRNMANRLKELN